MKGQDCVIALPALVTRQLVKMFSVSVSRCSVLQMSDVCSLVHSTQCQSSVVFVTSSGPELSTIFL